MNAMWRYLWSRLHVIQPLNYLTHCADVIPPAPTHPLHLLKHFILMEEDTQCPLTNPLNNVDLYSTVKNASHFMLKTASLYNL